jgi:hypothetical protein
MAARSMPTASGSVFRRKFKPHESVAKEEVLTDKPESRLLRVLAPALWVILLGWLSITLAGPPAAVPETAPPEVFSAERAMKHVREIARAPHPVGSAEHDRVRDYLLAQFSALGLEPAVQKTTGLLARYESAAAVENILARKKGSATGPGVLLAAHYDSVPAGPGAGDDGAGVAAILETARALQTGPGLRNDVIFLLTDAEEIGLLGAQAFTAEHPWAKQSGVVINLDNRGTSGAVVMYETSANNGWLIRQLADAAPQPRASSLAYAVSQRMPNSSDMRVFKEAGIAGLNLAFIGHPQNYHSLQDTPENLDPRSLQHHGNYALALARHFGNLDLTHVERPDSVYFNLVASWLVVYSSSGARILGICAVVLWLLVAVTGFRRGALTVSVVLWGILAFALSFAAAWGLALLAGWSLPRLHGRWLADGPYFFSSIYAAGLMSMVVAVTAAIWEVFLPRASWCALGFVGATLWTAAAAYTAFRIQEASYLFLWPAATTLAALGVAFALSPAVPRWSVGLIGLAAAPGVFLVAPLLPLLTLALGFSRLGTLAIAITVVLFLWLLAPLLTGPRPTRQWSLAGAAVLAALIILGWGVATVRYDGQHPRPESILYTMDADSGIARWVSISSTPQGQSDPAPDEWRRQYLSATPETVYSEDFMPHWVGQRFLTHQAPPLSFAPPQATLVAETKSETTRTLRLRITSLRHARMAVVQVTNVPVLDSHVNGKQFSPPPRLVTKTVAFLSSGAQLGSQVKYQWLVLFAGLPQSGFEITMEIPAGPRIQLKVIDYLEGLPVIPVQHFDARPDSVTQKHIADMTIVSKMFQF